MTLRNGQSMHELIFVIWLGQRNWGFSLPSTACMGLKLPHEFFIIQTNFIIGRFSHQDFQIYYLHHLHSVYTLFNSEAFDTWSTASADYLSPIFWHHLYIPETTMAVCVSLYIYLFAWFLYHGFTLFCLLFGH